MVVATTTTCLKGSDESSILALGHVTRFAATAGSFFEVVWCDDDDDDDVLVMW